MGKVGAMCGVPVSSFLKPTKSTAYLLGFLWADGSFPRSKRRKGLYGIRLEILTSDFIKIKEVFTQTGDWGITTRLRKGRTRKVTRAAISNKELYFYLGAMGYTSRKCGAAKILSALPERLHPLWFRGFFDGDGSVYLNRRLRTHQASISGPASQDWEFLTELFDKLGLKYSVNHYTSKKGHSSSSVRISSRPACLALGKYLYTSLEKFDSLGLKRKWSVFAKMYKEVSNAH